MPCDSNNSIKHIAIIMDGNGRWAKSRLKPRIFGHRSSISSVDAAIEYAENFMNMFIYHERQLFYSKCS